MEIVKVTLEPEHERAGLPVAAGLAAAKYALVIRAATSTRCDYRRIGAQQVGARIYRR